MMAPPYRAAVIGHTGRGDYGHGLDTAFRDHPKLKLVAVADEDARGRAEAARRLGIERSYADHRAMLQRERPEFVAVAPRWLDEHKEMVLACADQGVLGIFCEKPLAPDLGSCDAIVDRCDRSHVKLAMAFQTRYSPRYERIKALLAEGAIGEILELRARGKEDRRGGGEDLMVLGVHVFNLCHDLLGDPAWCFARVTERGRTIGAKEVREGAEGIGPLAGDRVDAMYGFKRSPAVAHFATTRPGEPGQRYGLTIGGSKGAIWMGTGFVPPAYLLKDPSWLATGESRWTPIEGEGQNGTTPGGSNAMAAGNLAILDDLIHAVETDTQPKADARAGRMAVEMAQACYASHACGGTVSMPLADRGTHPLRRLAPS